MERKLNKKTVLKEILEILIVIFFGAALSLSYVLFIVPNDFSPAGINGIAVMIQYLCNFSIGYLSLIINIPLCILAFFLVSKKFGIRSFIFTLAYSLFYLLFSNIDGIKVIIYDAKGVDTIYPVIIAGVISGVITSLSFKLSSSTGGTDIIGKYINKKWPNLNLFWIIFALNSIVAFISCFVYKTEGNSINYKPACLCILYCLIATILSNIIMKGTKSSYKFFIITTHPNEVEDMIIHKLKHTATRLNGVGIYSHQEKTVLVTVINKNQLVEFENLLKQVPDTFGYVETVYETLGNFKHIRNARKNRDIH